MLRCNQLLSSWMLYGATDSRFHMQSLRERKASQPSIITLYFILSKRPPLKGILGPEGITSPSEGVMLPLASLLEPGLRRGELYLRF